MSIRDKLSATASRAWSAAILKAKKSSGETKATAAGAIGGGVVSSTVGAHVGIAAFGTAVAGTAILPVVATVTVGAIVGFAAFKVYKDVTAQRSQSTAVSEVVPIAVTDARKDKS